MFRKKIEAHVAPAAIVENPLAIPAMFEAHPEKMFGYKNTNPYPYQSKYIGTFQYGDTYTKVRKNFISHCKNRGFYSRSFSLSSVEEFGVEVWDDLFSPSHDKNAVFVDFLRWLKSELIIGIDFSSEWMVIQCHYIMPEEAETAIDPYIKVATTGFTPISNGTEWIRHTCDGDIDIDNTEAEMLEHLMNNLSSAVGVAAALKKTSAHIKIDKWVSILEEYAPHMFDEEGEFLSPSWVKFVDHCKTLNIHAEIAHDSGYSAKLEPRLI